MLLHKSYHQTLDSLVGKNTALTEVADILKGKRDSPYFYVPSSPAPREYLSHVQKWEDFIVLLYIEEKKENTREEWNHLSEIWSHVKERVSRFAPRLLMCIQWNKQPCHVEGVTEDSACLYTANGFYSEYASRHVCDPKRRDGLYVKEYQQLMDLVTDKYYEMIPGAVFDSFLVDPHDLYLSESQIVKFCRHRAKINIPYYFLCKVDRNFFVVEVIKEQVTTTKGFLFKKTETETRFMWRKVYDEEPRGRKRRFIVPESWSTQ